MAQKIVAGLFGFGVVGEGLYKLIRQSGYPNVELKTIVVQDKEKKRLLPPERFHYNKEEILNDSEIELVFEVITDANEAFEIVKAALLSGKNVVTANKKMVATHLAELIQLQKETGKVLLYEAAVAGTIPVVQTVDRYLAWQNIKSIRGIFNGTSNYILTALHNGLNYQEALREAQLKGYAEADPTLDVGGYDAKFKSIILALHGFGKLYKPEDVFHAGIQCVDSHEIVWAESHNYTLKLVGNIYSADSGVSISILPEFVTQEDKLSRVDGVLNGATIETVSSGNYFLEGEGAGSGPTGQAVLSDVTPVLTNSPYTYNKGVEESKPINAVWNIYLKTDVEALLDQITFDQIFEESKYEGQHRIIGRISVSELEKLSESERKHVFIGKLPDNFLQSNKEYQANAKKDPILT